MVKTNLYSSQVLRAVKFKMLHSTNLAFMGFWTLAQGIPFHVSYLPQLGTHKAQTPTLDPCPLRSYVSQQHWLPKKKVKMIWQRNCKNTICHTNP